MNESEFEEAFRALTRHAPLNWQTRLFNRLLNNDIPPVIDIPTGLGKTMVMAIWLIARSVNCKLPRRLIYVVDRRTVVDQATDIAENFAFLLGPDRATATQEIASPELVEHKHRDAKLLFELRERLSLVDDGLAVSTLRGQLADNREWSRDPSRPAIIIGTVDLIGSALLFSGYRSSYKRRPLEAGLLGQDSLLVLDEAHLSKPFEKLVTRISSLQAGHGTPMKVVCMSATTGDSTDSQFPFTLLLDTAGNLTGDDAKDETIIERFRANKHLEITPDVDPKKLNDAIADAAIELAESGTLKGKRIVVFVRKPDDAEAIAQKIRDHSTESVDESGPKPRKIKNNPYAESVEVLTGTMRGLERDELVEKSVLKRFLNGDEVPGGSDEPVFLVSTSAGEVGMDLNADHMVGDATTIDSFIQRLGRVNRRGGKDRHATVILIRPKEPTEKNERFRTAIANTLELLTDGMPLSPQNIAALKAGPWKDRYDDACSPEPATVPLTDILLDAWSMTSIRERMPGRPDVGPWLRGIDDELPQTTIAWRAELDEPGFADLSLGDIEEWFDTHRILTHETLSVPTSAAAKWFADRWEKLDDKQKSEVGKRSIVVDRAGLKLVTVKDVIDQLSRKNTDSIRFAELILPASFGGIERHVGLLNAEAPKNPEDAKNADDPTRRDNAKARLVAPDVADLAEGLRRQREIITRTEDGEPETRIIGGGTPPPNPAHFRIELTSDDDCVARLVSHVPKREKLEYGSTKQTLQQHVDEVCKAADRILSRTAIASYFTAKLSRIRCRTSVERHAR